MPINRTYIIEGKLYRVHPTIEKQKHRQTTNELSLRKIPPM